MAGHFEAIGFPVKTREELEALSVLAANVGEGHDAGEQRYLRWPAGAGAEVWAQASVATKAIKGVNPYFASGEAVLAGTIETVLPHLARPHDGSITFIPEGDERRSALAGVPIALPDFQLALPALAPRKPARLSVAAFAHAFELLESAEGLGASGLSPGMLLKAQRDLTLGTGEVVRSELRTNPSGRRDFVWALLEVQGGKIDLLLDTDLHDEPLEEGQMCRGVFWLCGRLAS